MKLQTSDDKRAISAILSETMMQVDSRLVTASCVAPDLVVTIESTDVSRLQGISKLEFAAVTSELRRALTTYNADHDAIALEVAEKARHLTNEDRGRMLAQSLLVILAVGGFFVVPGAVVFSLLVLVGTFIARSLWIARLEERAEALSEAFEGPAAVLREKLGTTPAQARQAMWSSATGLCARADALYLESLEPAQRTLELATRHQDAQRWADQRFAQHFASEQSSDERSGTAAGLTVAC
ncbi:hypothetical protein ESZ53_11750 [Salinibacterium sp. UTAS2018]|uniref:hypothetical protein n=1 Tax=Salinibacterium sp. UTAS2018 TaxID=2508880 RepID=UPI00100956CD|nr:hypothetical protein [Salinibacterium sp. UTAS2018]QAV71055.1 hypothetical protein ESZ53_11750 [Salinibacterium sp. UTAS2018]